MSQKPRSIELVVAPTLTATDEDIAELAFIGVISTTPQ
jgi:hypothetical protein